MIKKKFEELQTTKLGNLGELLVGEFAKHKEAIPYIPALNQSNPVDSICLKNNKFFAIEVKTKASLKYYEYTGMDYADHITYLNFPIPVCVLFVDSLLGSIYYQWINKLDKVKEEKFGHKHVIYYPITSMIKYRDLTESEIEEQKKLSQSNY